MNPFTRFLRQWSSRPALSEFVDRWDVVERLVIRVFKSDQVTAADRAAFDEAWPWLREHYGEWAAELDPLWRATLVGGAPAEEDPFRRLLAAGNPAEFRSDWAAMQYLPAAREALNRLVLLSSSDAW